MELGLGMYFKGNGGMYFEGNDVALGERNTEESETVCGI